MASQEGKEMLTSAWESKEALNYVVWLEVLTRWPSAFQPSGKKAHGWEQSSWLHHFPEHHWTVKSPHWADPKYCFIPAQEVCWMWIVHLQPLLVVHCGSDSELETRAADDLQRQRRYSTSYKSEQDISVTFPLSHMFDCFFVPHPIGVSSMLVSSLWLLFLFLCWKSCPSPPT